MGDLVALNELLDRLVSGDADERADAARQICSKMEARRAEELAGDQSVVNTKLKRWLASMVSSKDQQDQLAAIALLSEMIEADSLEDNVMTRIVGQTRKLLQSSDEAVCGAALDIYRRLVQKRWTHVLQFAESDISWCLETLASGGSEARLLTMLQLTEIIGKEGLLSPNSSVPRVLASLSQPLRDSRIEIRIAAGRALGACLGIVPPSERNPHNPWLNLLYEELQRNQQAGSIESLHGSQLICQELLRNGGTYMEPRFAQACETATRLTGHRDTHVRRAAIEQLPVLARYSPQGFARTDAGGESTLSRSCRFLISLARSADPERHTAFVVLADIALACAADFAPLLGLTMGEIRGVLAQQARLHKKDAAADNPVTGGALKAISMLVTAMGPAIACHMHDTLDLMFAGGLNQALCHALRALVHNVDQLQPVVLARVVDMVSVILAGHPFRPAQHCLDDLEWRMGTMSMHYAVIAGNSPSDSATAKGVGHVPPATDPTAMVVQAASNIPVTTDTLVLALRTLREFDFSEENLAEFLRTVVLDYIVHSSAAVRSEAIQTAAHIVLSDPLFLAKRGVGFDMASEVVQQLLSAAVVDVDRDVRLTAVQMLEKVTALGCHMCKAQNIQDLAMLANDEVFEVRLAVLAVIGRLANMNPLHGAPSLRRVMMPLVTELQYATNNHKREECVQLLTALVRAADGYAQIYAGTICKMIVPLIDTAPPQLATKLFDAVTALVRVGSCDLEPYYDGLLARIVCALSEGPRAPKCLAALKALSSCASYGNMAVTPYTDFPQLFGILSAILKDESNPQMHAEALRAVGALGAIDPRRFKNALVGGTGGSDVTVNSSTAASASSKIGRRRERDLYRHSRVQSHKITVFRSEGPETKLAGSIPERYDGTEFTTDAYFTDIAVDELLGILNDAANTKQHLKAAQALTSMFVSLKASAEPYIERSLEAIRAAMSCTTSESAHRDFYIKRIQQLVEIAPQILLPHLPSLCELFSAEDLGCSRQQTMTIELLNTLVTEFGGYFGRHTPTAVSYLIAVIDQDDSESRAVTRKALSALQTLGWLLDDHHGLFVPRLLALLDPAANIDPVVAASLECLEVLITAVNCSTFASHIALTLVRLLQSVPAIEIQESVFDVLCALMEQLQEQFMRFMPTIAAMLRRPGISSNVRYERNIALLLDGRLVAKELPRLTPTVRTAGHNAGTASRQAVDLVQLRRAWNPGPHMTEDSSIRWLDSLTHVLLQQSPHVSLRACSELAMPHTQLGHNLFNAAFVSCWKALNGEHQQEIAALLQNMASNENVPTAVLQKILHLAEYMERDNEHLPIDRKLIASYATRCHALAKELHYTEAAWSQDANYDTMIKLIELNQSLDLRDSAIGVLDYVHKEHSGIEDTAVCFMRLQRWDDALALYRRQAREGDLTHENTMQQIRCLFELSDWGTLVQMYNQIEDSDDRDLHQMAARLGVRMAWATADTNRMKSHLARLPANTGEKSYYTALLAVHQGRASEAAEHIAEARKAINFRQLLYITHSDIHGYSQMFQCQLLTELEEIIEYKSGCSPERQRCLVRAWDARLGGMQQEVAIWQRALRLRSLALRPIHDVDTWVELSNMSRRSGDMNVAKAAISRLLNDEAEYLDEINRGAVIASAQFQAQAREYARLKDEMLLPSMASSAVLAAEMAWKGDMHQSGMPSEHLDREVRLSQQPAVVYTYLKYKWAKGECADALNILQWYAQDLSDRLGFDARNPDAFRASSTASASDISMLARLYYRQAEWMGSGQLRAAGEGAPGANAREPETHRSNTDELETRLAQEEGPVFYKTENDDADGSILESYRVATVLDRKWYKAWHALALRHYLVVQRYELTKVHITNDIAERHLVPAIHGFFRAVQLSKDNITQQDTLRLLSVWFKYSHIESVAQTVQDKLGQVRTRTWLQVIPQILAQMSITSPRVRQQVQKLLIRIGEQYPQAILFPLYVVVRSDSKVRARAAREVLESIYDEHAKLVRETEGVSRELIRTTMLVSEQWQEAMVAAHAYYYANQSDKRVLPMLKAMHETARHPETPYEHHFVQTYGQYIAAAEAALDECLAETDPERKWDLLDAIWAPYNRLSQRIVKELATLESVSFKNTAPALLKYRDLQLAIPGTYAPGEDPVTIQAIDPQVKIHTTKQRPRQMNMVGSDGKQYVFLIKGREDLRQDERVMQVFGLVNSLLARDKGTARRSLAIERFPAVPLSPNSGLIGFYPNCSSIDKLVRCYRQARSVPGDLEQRLSHQFTPNWDSLTLMQKVESFEYAQANTSGDDLQRIMWYRSPNSEEWLARRTNYTRSLAVMSMAGYILGLGDRHPNNVLIHERTGKVVHIDLGDCFESAAQRDRFPEKVPFRLTRMLIKAMGVTGIEGAFRRSAYHTIRVLRANRDSMMAVLEAFVFDPLMTWVSIREPDEDPDRAPDTQQRPRQQCDNLMAHSMAGGNSAAGSTWVRQVARIGGLGASTYVAPNRKWQDGNSKALAIVKRIHDKLVGCDFDRSVRLGENKQVEKLIQQATSVDNLVVLYSGWVPHW